MAALVRAVPPDADHDVGRVLSRKDFHSFLDRQRGAHAGEPLPRRRPRPSLPRCCLCWTPSCRMPRSEEMARLYGTPADAGREADMEVAVPVDAASATEGGQTVHRFTYRDDRGGRSVVSRRDGNSPSRKPRS